LKGLSGATTKNKRTGNIGPKRAQWRAQDTKTLKYATLALMPGSISKKALTPNKYKIQT